MSELGKNVIAFGGKQRKASNDLRLAFNGRKIGFTAEQFFEGLRGMTESATARLLLAHYAHVLPGSNHVVINDVVIQQIAEIVRTQDTEVIFWLPIGFSESVEGIYASLNQIQNMPATVKAEMEGNAESGMKACSGLFLNALLDCFEQKPGQSLTTFEIIPSSEGLQLLSKEQKGALKSLITHLDMHVADAERERSALGKELPVISLQQISRPNAAAPTISGQVKADGVLHLDTFRQETRKPR